MQRRRTLKERTTRTGSPLTHETLSAAFMLSNFWSKLCTLLVRLLPLKSRPPLPVYRNHSPSSRSSSYLCRFCYATLFINKHPHPPESTTDWAPALDCPAMPATWGKWAPH